jgi:hypothetical protein
MFSKAFQDIGCLLQFIIPDWRLEMVLARKLGWDSKEKERLVSLETV